MLSAMSREGLVGIGARFRAAHLVEQAAYTLELASHDGSALDHLLPAGYIDEVKRVVGSVQGAMSLPALTAAESRQVGEASSREVRAARSWRQKVARRAVRARAIGRDVPDAVCRVSELDSASDVVTQVSSMVAWMDAEGALLPGDDIGSLAEKGKALAKKLGDRNVGEHAARLAHLPATDQRFCEEKGGLFVGLRVINDAAQELHRKDRESASRYNLSILAGRIASERP